MCFKIFPAILAFLIIGIFFPIAIPFAGFVFILGICTLFSDWHKWRWLDSIPKLKQLMHEIFD